MWTLSSCGLIPKSMRMPDRPSAASSGEAPDSGRNTPLGLPVVPDV